MAKCEFSETRFEAYHSRQFERLFGGSGPQFFPSRAEEGNLGWDMQHVSFGANYFFQYKVPASVKNSYWKCDGLEGNCFRIRIYNRSGTKSKSQYGLLWELAQSETHVYYATPEFVSIDAFRDKYTDIIASTAHFRVADLKAYNNEFNEEQHYIFYDDSSNFGKMFSEEAKTVKKYKNGQLYSADAEGAKNSQASLNSIVDNFSRLEKFLNSGELDLREETSLENRFYNLSEAFKKEMNLNWFMVLENEHNNEH